ncbi:FxLYD domain-containing protein [Pontibacillus salicampi]|uniref:FxLYD domain-containing protein n=2 Tax=Pontibacillus salicampi TaxID=1449801 RepID=A0ABV6LIJ3_9BACI
MKQNERGFNRWWFLPLAVCALSIIALGASYFMSEMSITSAQEKFKKGETLALDGKYEKAHSYFEEAADLAGSFTAATENQHLMNLALHVEKQMDQAKKEKGNKQYQLALQTLADAENELRNLNGEVVTELVQSIANARNDTKVEQLQQIMNNEPNIEKLQSIIWQAEDIQTDEGKALTAQIKEQIISYAASHANNKLKQKQFSKARDYVEDGLRFAPESDKLQSLKTTIEKEKTAFETAQKQRIEQATNAAKKEQEMNKNDAIEVTAIDGKKNQYGDFIVKGELKSSATVPLTSISVTYTLRDENGETVHTNKVYAYPDTLFPGEKGKFEYTHYEAEDGMEISVDQVSWFLQ